MAGSNLPPQAYTRETLAHAYEWLKAQPASVREIATTADALVGLYLQSKRRLRDGVHTYGLHDSQTAKSKKQFKSELKNLQEQVKEFELTQDPPTEVIEDPGPVINTETINRLIREPQMDNPPTPSQTKRDKIPTPIVYNNTVSQEDTVDSPSSRSNVLSQPQVQVVVQQPGQQDRQSHFSQSDPNMYPTNNRQQEPQSTQSLQPTQNLHPPQQQQSQPAPQQQQPVTPPHPGNYSQFDGVRYEMDPVTKSNLEEVRRRLNLSSENEALRVLVAIGYDKVRQILPNN